MKSTIKVNEDLGYLINNIIPGFHSNGSQSENEIMLIVDTQLNVIYSNSTRDYWTDLENLAKLNVEPNLTPLIEIFAQNRINFLTLEVSLEDDLHNIVDYKVDITKIDIKSENYYLLVFGSLEKKELFERNIINLTSAMDYGQIPVIIADEKAELIYSNSSFENILNKEIEHIFKQPLAGIFEPYLTLTEKTLFQNSIDNHNNWKKTLIINKENKTHYYEFSLRPVYYNNNNTWNFIVTANDITDYILKHQEIKRSETWLKSIINNISDLLLVLIKDGDGYKITISNQNFVDCIEKSNLENSNIKDVFEAEFCAILSDKLNLIDSEKTLTTSFEKQFGNKGKHFEIAINVMLDPIDNKKYYILRFRDISARLTYERQLENAYKEEIRLNQIKTDFLENMSHELRTPTNAIVGYTEIIRELVEDKDYEDLPEILDNLQDVLERVIKLFGNIVEQANINENNIELNIVEININQVVKSVHEKYQKAALTKGLNFYTEFEDESLLVKTDWVKIEKILQLLTDNAIKYTSAGRIKISTYLDDKQGIIEISDSGIGIEKEQMDKLLIPFNQGVAGYTREYQGVGLGLSIAYKLAIMIGGKMFIKSEINTGTIITLKLPTK